MPLPPPPPPPPRGGRPTGLIVAVVMLAVGLAAVSVAALGLIGSQQRTIERLRAQVEELEAALAEAGDPPEAAGEPDAPGPGGLLDGLGEGLGERFSELLDELLGDDGELLSCLQPRHALDPLPPGGADDRVAEIADRVEELRGLAFPDPVDARFLPAAEFEADLRERAAADLDREQADVERRRLATLGAIPPETDLVELHLELVTGQAAGFYDSTAEEIVVRVEDSDATLRPLEQVTLAHELEHALSDAMHGLPLGDDAPDGSDARLAALSLVEGGATVTMQHYAAAVLPVRDQLSLGMDPSIADARAQLEGFPHHVQRELLFPYEEGLAFTCRLLRDGGWAAVDDAYGDLPATTAQILWPERYVDGEAAVPVSPAPPGGRGEGTTTTFGAAELLWLFEAPGGDRGAALDDPLERASAWAGGEVTTWAQDDGTAVALRLVDRGEGPGLCGSVRDWYTRAFPGGDDATAEDGETLSWDGGGQHAVLMCDGDRVQLGVGPDAEAARALTR